VAGAATLLARLIRGSWRSAAFQASEFALASGRRELRLRSRRRDQRPPTRAVDDLVPLTVLALIYLLVSRGLLQLIGSGEVLQPDFSGGCAALGTAPDPPRRGCSIAPG